MSRVEVVVRAARVEDGGVGGVGGAESAARAALVRRGLRQAYPGAVLYFVCQELIVQCCVLCGAVLFIFLGSSPLACATLVPGAVLAVSAAVALAHAGYARQKHRDMWSEEAGWVAEARGVPTPPDRAPPRGALVVRLESTQSLSLSLNDQGAATGAGTGAGTSVVVGTVSLSRHRAEPYRRVGYLHALAVHPQWQRRGVARALVGRARAWAASRGFESLESHTTELAEGARACLHAVGWRLRGSYRRPIVWSALTLPVAQLTLPLPYA